MRIKVIPKGIRTVVEGSIDSSLVLRIENCSTCFGEVSLLETLGDKKGYFSLIDAFDGAKELGYGSRCELGIVNISINGGPHLNQPWPVLLLYSNPTGRPGVLIKGHCSEGALSRFFIYNYQSIA